MCIRDRFAALLVGAYNGWRKEGIWLQNGRLTLRWQHGFHPVSYTHLDVYKSQAVARASNPKNRELLHTLGVDTVVCGTDNLSHILELSLIHI